MPKRKDTLEAIYNIGLLVGQNQEPWLAFLVGFLAGQAHRTHFVKSLSGAEIAVHLDLRRMKVWPGQSFRGTYKGITLPNPFTLVKAIQDSDLPICVYTEFDHMDNAGWYQDVLAPDVSYAKDAQAAAEEESSALWQEMDRSLDVFRECKALFAEADPEKKRELSYYMDLAREQMRRLSAEMDALNKRMKRIDDDDEL